MVPAELNAVQNTHKPVLGTSRFVPWARSASSSILRGFLWQTQYLGIVVSLQSKETLKLFSIFFLSVVLLSSLGVYNVFFFDQPQTTTR